jgi:hypothetical protein
MQAHKDVHPPDCCLAGTQVAAVDQESATGQQSNNNANNSTAATNMPQGRRPSKCLTLNQAKQFEKLHAQKTSLLAPKHASSLEYPAQHSTAGTAGTSHFNIG